MRPPLIPNSWKTVDFFFIYKFFSPTVFLFVFFFFVYLKLFRYRKCRLHTCAMFFVCLRSPDSFLACFDRNSRRSLPSPSPTLVVFINKLSARIADETKSREECYYSLAGWKDLTSARNGFFYFFFTTIVVGDISAAVARVLVPKRSKR